MVDISFIIVNWNSCDILINCLNSIYKTVNDVAYEIYVVDNNSTDGSREAIKNKFPDVNLIVNKTNTGFSHANNQALAVMNGRYAVLLNTDAVLKENAIKDLLSFMNDSPKAGIAGVQLLNPDGSKQNSIDNFPSLETEIFNKSLLRLILPRKYPGKSRDIKAPIEVDTVIGACMIIRKEAIDDVGTFDEDYFFFLEETDWCYRMRRWGWKVYHVPDARVFHLSGHSKKKDAWKIQIEYYRSLYKYFRKNKCYASYIALRVLKPIKVVFNLFLNIIGNIIALFMCKHLRGKMVKYHKLFIWHLLLCPDSMGIEKE